MGLPIHLAESGMAPDWLVRTGIRALLRQRLREEGRKKTEKSNIQTRSFPDLLRQNPIAVHTQNANEQHYELPPDFFLRALGKRLKYSCCYYPSGLESLDQAEEHMLALTCERAQLQDDLDILELGCGWGSLTLWMAEHYPEARIMAVSNSKPQREFILEQCREHGFGNIRVITADMNDFDTEKRFDRILSIEMFEHMRNFELLLDRVASWMRPEAKLFIHIFCHREYAYLFETEGTSNWMGRYFLIMPSYNLLFSFQNSVAIERQWRVSGIHYQKTAEQWLANMDRRRRQIIPVLEATYGKRNAERWFQRWRIFFMACAELWGYRDGEEWHVAHYLFRKNRPSHQLPVADHGRSSDSNRVREKHKGMNKQGAD
jgi:cyclopropane-fatty-acyl-phospholipid synthase